MIFHQSTNSLGGYSYNARFYTDTHYDEHFHKNYELILVLRGQIRCTVNRKEYLLSEGELGLCLPYDVHSIHPAEESEYWVLVFSADYVRLFANRTAGMGAESFVFTLSPDMEHLLVNNLVRCNTPSVYLMKSVLYGVVSEYERQIRTVPVGVKGRVAADIISFVEENHTKSISLKALSAKLGYDYNYTSRYFRRAFDMTFSEFLNVYRLQTALSLLEDATLSVTQVAYESGFSSIRNFNTVFREKMNRTPP